MLPPYRFSTLEPLRESWNHENPGIDYHYKVERWYMNFIRVDLMPMMSLKRASKALCSSGVSSRVSAVDSLVLWKSVDWGSVQIGDEGLVIMAITMGGLTERSVVLTVNRATISGILPFIVSALPLAIGR